MIRTTPACAAEVYWTQCVCSWSYWLSTSSSTTITIALRSLFEVGGRNVSPYFLGEQILPTLFLANVSGKNKFIFF